MFSLFFNTNIENVAPKLYSKYPSKDALHFLYYQFDEKRNSIFEDFEEGDNLVNRIKFRNMENIKIQIPHVKK